MGGNGCGNGSPGDPDRTIFLVWEGHEEVGTYYDKTKVEAYIEGEINPCKYSIDKIEIFGKGSVKFSQASGKDIIHGRERWQIPSYDNPRLKRVLEESGKSQRTSREGLDVVVAS